MSYQYYGRSESRASDTRGLGDVALIPRGRPSLLHPWEETGLGTIPIWDGLSKNEKTLLVLGAVGAFLWWTLGKKMPGRKNPSRRRRRLRRRR